ncbi:MAG: DUF4358 domain-containing protein [Clostridia bacterium]
MKKNTKILIIILLIFIFICVGLVLSYAFIPKNDTNQVQINLEELSKNIENIGKYSEIPSINITKENVEEILKIAPNMIEDIIGAVPLVNIKSSMYTVLKVKPENFQYVKQKVDEYGTLKENEWSSYLSEQYELVKSRKIGTKGNYIYMIISSNADEIEKIIK